MKMFFGILMYVIIPVWLTAQEKGSLVDRSIDNSFKKTLAEACPGLKYSYDKAKHIHDYSGNWDFDGDNKMDSIYFIGDNALRYFHLQIILSSGKKKMDFPWLVTDFPLLVSFDFLQKTIRKLPSFATFVVYDFNNDGKMSIYFYLNTKVNPIPVEWKKKGVSSPHILLGYKNKKLLIKNFPSTLGGMESVQ